MGIETHEISRRTWLLSASAAALVGTMLGGVGEATAQEAPNGWEDAVKKLIGEGKLVEGKMNVELPEIAENGNTVPFTVAVDSPMTDRDYVSALHIFSTGNPQSLISTFYFTPAAGRAAASGRLRLARTQDIVTVAALSNGEFLMSKRLVKVTIGGCGG